MNIVQRLIYIYRPHGLMKIVEKLIFGGAKIKNS
jgi:hypothetical protein